MTSSRWRWATWSRCRTPPPTGEEPDLRIDRPPPAAGLDSIRPASTRSSLLSTLSTGVSGGSGLAAAKVPWLAYFPHVASPFRSGQVAASRLAGHLHPGGLGEGPSVATLPRPGRPVRSRVTRVWPPPNAIPAFLEAGRRKLPSDSPDSRSVIATVPSERPRAASVPWRLAICRPVRTRGSATSRLRQQRRVAYVSTNARRVRKSVHAARRYS
jgi:hypothetical protein